MNNVVFFRQAFVGASLLLYGLSPAMAIEGEELIPSVGISGVQQQGRRVTCVISDKGGPIIGANVLVKGTNNGNISDMDGRVILENVPNNAILVVSYIGYVTQEIPLKNSQNNIKVKLVEDTQNLDEVVVVGYGTQAKKDITGSVAVVSSDAIHEQPVSTFAEALQGKASGVYISNSGGPSGETTIRIRGVGSLNSSDPLIVMGGDANKGSTAADQSDFTLLETYSFTTDNSYILRKWEAVYDAVSRANNVMHLAGSIKDELSAEPGQEKDFYTETLAQARFIRGFYMLEGIKNFGVAIPFVTLEDFEESVNPLVSNVDENGNYIYVWDKVAKDLQFAYENLPNAWPNESGRANKWAAAAFLAKLRVFQSSPYNGTNATSNHWAEAKQLIETILANGVDSRGTKYCLTPNYETLYTAGESDWTGESVFDVQMAISGTQYYTNAINGTAHIALSGKIGSGWGFYQPSYDLVNAHMVDGDGLPFLDKSYQSKTSVTTIDGNNVPHTDLAVFTDPRLDVSTGRFNVPYMDWDIPVTIDGWIRDLANGGPFLNKKNLPKKADKGGLSLTTNGGSSAKNFHLMRVAELYLLYAEACIETGDLETARAYINKVRARAANSCIMAADPNADMAPTTSAYILDDKVNGNNIANSAANYRIGLYPAAGWTKERATQALRFERRIELAMEGHHWYDLVRWNIASEELGNTGNGFLAYERNFLLKYQSATYPDRLVTLPIPNDEIVTMEGLLVQNENWK